MKPKAQPKFSVEPRVRVWVGKEVALGPGKIDLLEGVRQTGSIREAARRMDMSYMRAWTLIRTMNECFQEPLVKAMRGGNRGGGGAELTETGMKALELYKRMEAACVKGMDSDWGEMQRHLR